MNKLTTHYISLFILINGIFSSTLLFSATGKVSATNLIQPSPKTYYINPNTGNDQNKGTGKTSAWKTFKQINRLRLAAGTTVEILAAGSFHESLVIKADGKQQAPVKLKFAPGKYHIYSALAEKRQLHIANTNDRPDELKAIALMFDRSSYVEVQGTGATMIMHGKMIETFVDHSNNINITGLSFDYNRPTVSELKITNIGTDYADAIIHPDSKYSIKDSVITWIGDGWSYQPGSYWQALNPQTNDLSRMSMPMKDLRFVQKKGQEIRIYFKRDAGLKTGYIYQNRDVTRDCSGIFMQYSSDIQLRDIRLYFMHGMGVVSQYCHNIKMDKVVVRPDGKSGRTCAAWADILHFAGCSGKIEVSNSYLSAANDDAVNVHGIHLKITDIQGDHKIRVKFMHDQTYGFNAFAAGDSVALIGAASLLAIQDNQLVNAEKLNDKEFLLTLSKPIAKAVKIGDAVENVSATPEVWIHHTTITRIPTRGVLATTRRKVLIEHNTFENTHMSAIFINNDASSWFESGMVKDFTIRENKFIRSGEPIINIHPENTVTGTTAVHNNIKVTDNHFWLHGDRLLEAKSTGNIKISGNTIYNAAPDTPVNQLLKFTDCTGIDISGNKLVQK